MSKEIQDTKEEEINLLDLFAILLKHKGLIILITLATALLATIITSIMPPKYVAEAKVRVYKVTSPSVESQLISDITIGIANQQGPPSIQAEQDFYAYILKSRTILDAIVDRLDLVKYYQVNSHEDARNILASSLKVKVDKQGGVIVISVEDKDPKKAAQLANAFVDELKKAVKNFTTEEAKQKRLILEEILANVRTEIEKVKEEIKSLQGKNLDINNQEKPNIDSIIAQIDEKRIQEDIKRIKDKLKNLEENSEAPSNSQIAEKLKALKLNQYLYELLLKQYEIMKLDEIKNIVVVQVIDRAIPPEKKAKPKKGLIIAVSTFTALFASILLAFLIEYVHRVSNDPENRELIENIKNSLSFRRKD